MTPLPLMLFAAGFGTRMGALTRNRPKPLIEVAGKPLIDRALSLAKDAKVAPVVINLHYKADMLTRHLAGRNVGLSLETPDILDTGGGLRHALPMLGTGPVATLNSDVIWRGPNPLTLLRAGWDPDRMDALLMCVPLSRTVAWSRPGDFSADDAGRISRGGDLVYGGAQIIRPEGLRDIPDTSFSLNRLWDRLLMNNRLYAAVYPGHWCDVGHPDGILAAERMLEARDVQAI